MWRATRRAAPAAWGHVTNRLQKMTAAQLSRVSSALHSLADTAGAQYKALVLHVELTWSLLGKRSHNIDKAIFGQIDFKQLMGLAARAAPQSG